MSRTPPIESRESERRERPGTSLAVVLLGGPDVERLVVGREGAAPVEGSTDALSGTGPEQVAGLEPVALRADAESSDPDGSRVGTATGAKWSTRGDGPSGDLVADLPGRLAAKVGEAGSSVVVAVDSGLHRAAALGLAVDVVIGDMDSVVPDILADSVARGAVVERHPEVKDHTDLALALRWVAGQGIGRALLVGCQVGRLDHLLAMAFLLGDPEHRDLHLEAWLGAARLHVAGDARVPSLDGEVGELVSLFAVGGPARGVTSTGLLYGLEDDELHQGSTRGVSNELVAPPGSLTVEEGTVLAVLPGEQGDHHARDLLR